ncbi:MAG: GUN4 domain-containing protein, partial [Prochlorothrix sp.]
QAYLCEEDRIEGYERTFKERVPLLEEVFVPLELSGGMEAMVPSMPPYRQPYSSGESLQIWDLLAQSQKNRRFRHMSILAKGGMGKSTLLRHVALRYGQGKIPRSVPRFIPVLLRLRTLIAPLTQADPPQLPALITDHHLPTLGELSLQPPEQWTETILAQGRALVMLDGFDEVPEPDRPPVSQWIHQQIRTYPRAVFIVTSRPAGFTEEFYTAPRPALTIFVQKFSPPQQEKFIQRWYLCQESIGRSNPRQKKHARTVAQERTQALVAQIEERREELGYLAENPLLLNMLVTFHRLSQGQPLPQQRLNLYQRIVQLQLEDRPRVRNIVMVLPYGRSLWILQQVALKMVEVKELRIAQASLLRLLGTLSLWEVEGVDPAEWVRQVVEVSELLVEREPGEYEFPHASFQGFFAASYLAKAEKETRIQANFQLILDHWQEAIWRETVLLYTAQLPPKRFSALLKQASQLGSEAAQLALDCLREYPRPEKLDAQLQQELAGLRQAVTHAKYRTLEALLAAQDWKKADQETYRLMITTVGKEEGQWFEREELLNFPCEDLLAIDGLWRKYSQGRYGFSVQKEIYVKCGAKLDGQYPGDKIWEKFGDSVGWRVENGKWLRYDNLKWGGTGVPGHLPFVTGVGLYWFGGGGVVSSLASRLVDCSR